MNFKEFWYDLQVELKQEKELTTLKQHRKFKAHFECNKHDELMVRVTPEHNEIQRGPIPSNKFEGIWNSVKGNPRETRFENKNIQLEQYPKKGGGVGKSMQIPYITKLIDHIVQDHDLE